MVITHYAVQGHWWWRANLLLLNVTNLHPISQCGQKPTTLAPWCFLTPWLAHCPSVEFHICKHDFYDLESQTCLEARCIRPRAYDTSLLPCWSEHVTWLKESFAAFHWQTYRSEMMPYNRTSHVHVAASWGPPKLAVFFEARNGKKEQRRRQSRDPRRSAELQL